MYHIHMLQRSKGFSAFVHLLNLHMNLKGLHGQSCLTAFLVSFMVADA